MEYKILLTGANRGLGLEMTGCFLAQGHSVWAVSRGRSEALTALEDGFKDRLHCLSGDMTDEASIKRAMEAVSRQTDRLDMVINNAAVHLERTAPTIESVDFSMYLTTFLVNSVAPLMVVKHSLNLLKKGGRKLIVNISSEAGSISAAWRKSEYSYCMSKAALNMANQILQIHLKKEGVKVLALHPGWFRSDMGGNQAPISPAEAAQNVVKIILGSVDLSGPGYVDYNGNRMEW
jgi:NAD(P)-dependent dehydrogenase (short-subunit alcohol dehydrogenase family)